MAVADNSASAIVDRRRNEITEACVTIADHSSLAARGSDSVFDPLLLLVLRTVSLLALARCSRAVRPLLVLLNNCGPLSIRSSTRQLSVTGPGVHSDRERETCGRARLRNVSCV